MDRDEVNTRLREWTFSDLGFGEWRGVAEDGRRTAIKRGNKTHTALQLAQNDVLNGRVLCPRWPNCVHYVNGTPSESIEACVAAQRREDHRLSTIGMKDEQVYGFRGRREAYRR
jgi:hypothetical protein